MMKMFWIVAAAIITTTQAAPGHTSPSIPGPFCTQSGPKEDSRGIPRIFLLGAQKCGTTSLNEDMHRTISNLVEATIPLDRINIDPAYFKKELHFFDNLHNRFDKGANFYGAYFPKCADLNGREPVDATPGYFSSGWREARPWDRAKLFYDRVLAKPDYDESMVFIVIVRDPVDRFVSAYEHYKRSKRKGLKEANMTLTERVNEALEKCPKGPILGENRIKWICFDEVLVKGVYSIALEGWVQKFPKAQFIFTTFTHYLQAPEEVQKAIGLAVGLHHTPLNTASTENVFHHPKHLLKAELAAKKQLKEYYQPHDDEFWKMLKTYTEDKHLRVQFIGKDFTYNRDPSRSNMVLLVSLILVSFTLVALIKSEIKPQVSNI